MMKSSRKMSDKNRIKWFLRKNRPKTEKYAFRRGSSLAEIMIAAVVLTVVIIGTTNLRYYAALDSRKAVTRAAAARIGLLLCESWRGVEGAETYDPTTHLGSDLAITTGTGPDVPEGFASLGSYTVVSNGAHYYTTLSWKDVYTGLRALNVTVSWAQRGQGETSVDDADKSFALTTYAQN